MLVNETLFGTVDKVQIAIERFRQFEPPEGYYGAFSGGKDSETIKKLAELAGVKVDWHYNPTGIDPPELVYHIRNKHPDVTFERRKQTMWSLIVERQMPPTRIARYCCEVLKEVGGEGRFVITGVRWAESVKRKRTRGIVEVLNSRKDKKILLNNDNDESRRLLETCISKGKRILNPIVDWKDEDVWEFIRTQNIKYCSLYDEGFHRLGCIGCPMARKGGRLKEFARWPKFYDAYMRAFDRMVKANLKRKGQDVAIWKTAQDVMDWWIYEMPNDPNQLKMFGEEIA